MPTALRGSKKATRFVRLQLGGKNCKEGGGNIGRWEKLREEKEFARE